MKINRHRLISGLLAAALLVGAAVANAPTAPALAAGTASTDQPAAVTPTASASVTYATSGWLHTRKGEIKTASNRSYVIKATSWFGMETATCAPHGLWTISLDEGLAQIKSMGFNTIRLPFSNECIRSTTLTSGSNVNFTKNPSLEGTTPLEVMDIVVARAKVYGINIILDRHRPSSSGQSELWYTAGYSEAKWISDWKKLAKRYKSEPTVIGFDLHNEPHGKACWGCGKKSTDWRLAAMRAGNAVLKVNSRLLIIVEGVDKQSSTSYTWWGGALAAVAKKPVRLSVAHRVVYSPHDYPASVYRQSWFTARNYPNNLTTMWKKNWGYIAQKGIAPVLLGEFGTKLETKSDRQWLAKLVGYLKKTKISFAYWSFNPNSGDTGGLVKDDWVTPQSKKLTALKPIIGSGRVVPVIPADPTDPTDPVPTPTPTPTPTPSPSGSPTPAVSAAWSIGSSWAAGYVANIDVSSVSGASSWTISWSDSKLTRVVNSWGMTCTYKAKKSVTCTGSDFGIPVAAGATVRPGLVIEASRVLTAPKFTITAK